jgi:PBSX family phage terminase large subunit
VLKGGRGSTKSTFVAIEILYRMIEDMKANRITNCVALRKTANTLKDSVYSQFLWAIDKLNLNEFVRIKLSPLEIIFKSTGQKIIFRGADDEIKLKSIKFQKGYCKYAWYEELDSFDGMEQIRSINQSLMRGGADYCIFYSYNPPKSINNWVNAEMLIDRSDRLIHHSTYQKVPTHWLGEQFIIEAKHLEKVKPDKYRHEYLGEAIGSGGQVFDNITLQEITDEEISHFDNVARGIDWGYVDPFAYTVNHYDKTRRKLYIFFELYITFSGNRKPIELVKKENVDNTYIFADSAEPKSIREFRENNVNVRPAKKGPGSVEHGIKWLQDLEEIIIDPKRCPNTAREFSTYELERDKQGNFRSEFPDKNNHILDCTRYSLERAMDGYNCGIC